MKKYLYVIIGCIFILQSCRNVNQKEIGEVDALLKIMADAEELLQAVDTSDLYSITTFVKADLKRLREYKDTLTKEAAFKVDDYIGRKKTLYALATNYSRYEFELKEERKQLNNLKQDLENNLIKKEDFVTYYESEQRAVLHINDQISIATEGMAERIKKMIDGREEFLKVLADSSSYLSVN